jgi:hypothetical protein
MAVRRKPKLRFFVILGIVVIGAAVAVILVIQSKQTVAVEEAIAKFTANFDVLVIRDEVVYEAKNYGKTEFIAVEGERVEIGDPIVEVYEWGYNDTTYSELLDLQKTILDYEADVIRAGIIDEQLIDINLRISNKALEIQQAVSGEAKDLLALERQMKELLDERSTYLRNVMPDNQLTEYLKQEGALLELIAGWRQTVRANEPGIISFYFDGNEALMNKDNIGGFSRLALEEVIDGKTIKTSSDDQAFVPLYRVVKEDEWYVILLSEVDIPEMHIGNGFSIIFDDYLDEMHTGVVFDKTILENNDGFVYTILIRGNIGSLLGERRVSAKLHSEQTGMRIPRSYIKSTEEVLYVETVDGQIVPVYLIAEDGDNVFIQTYKDEASLELGQLLRK